MSNTHQPSTIFRRLMGLVSKMNAAFKNGRTSEETLAELKKERDAIIGELRGRAYVDIRNRVSVFAVQEPEKFRLEGIGVLFGHRQREYVSQLREARKMLGLETEPIGDLIQHTRQLASRLVKEGLVTQVDTEKEFGDLAQLATMLQEAEAHRFGFIFDFARIEMPSPSENTEKKLGELRQHLAEAEAKEAKAGMFTEMKAARQEVTAIKEKIAALSNPPAVQTPAPETPEASLADLQQQLTTAKEARGLADSEADFNAAAAEIRRLEALISAKSREDKKPTPKPQKTQIPPPPPAPTVESVTAQAADMAEEVEFDLDTFRPPARPASPALSPELERRQKALQRLEELAEKANGYKSTILAAVGRLRTPAGESMPTVKVEELAQQWDEHIQKEQRH